MAAKPQIPAAQLLEERARLVAAAEMDPDNPQPALNVALFDGRTQHGEDAKRELLAIVKRFPDFVEAKFQLGSLYLDEGDNDAALPYLTKAAKLATDRYDVQLMAGLASFRLNHYADARNYADRALHLNPDAPAAYLLLARIYSNSGRAQQSMGALHAYLLRSKEPEPGYYLMGRLYYRQADQANAEHWLRQAIAARADNPDTWAVLGHVYSELENGRRVDEGITCFQKALALRSHDWETEAALGRALMQKQQWQDAIAQLTAAVQDAPDSGPLLYTLGQALLRSGRTEEAKRMLAQYQAYRDYTNGSASLKRAIEQDPTSRARRYALARHCLSYGQLTAAQAVLTEVERKFGPDDTLRRLQARVTSARAARSAQAP